MIYDKLKITFVLPFAGTEPCGGPKVVYEYAKHLVRRGHTVTVVHAAYCSPRFSWKKFGKSAIRYVLRKIDQSYRPDRWFVADPKVRMLWVWSLAERNIPDGDVVIATWWQTAEYVNTYSAAKGCHAYLIQGWETWDGYEDRVRATWKMPLKKIVISQWLHTIATQMGEAGALIPNGLDFTRFGTDTSPQDRNSNRCMMLYHKHALKGSADGLAAFHIVKQQIPELEVALFGTSAAPPNLPDWMQYHQLPEQTRLRTLYNSAAIFVAPSWSEGWPLPPAEAMQCGDALVATDIGGHREYAIHDETALLSPPKNPETLAANILHLLRNPETRIRIATQGHRHIQQFTWESATEKLEAALFSEQT